MLRLQHVAGFGTQCRLHWIGCEVRRLRIPHGTPMLLSSLPIQCHVGPRNYLYSTTSYCAHHQDPQQPLISSSLEGPPVAKLVPPGQCQFGENFQSATLVDRMAASTTASILRFSLPDEHEPLRLSTCACILAKADIHGQEIIRPYTPISTNQLVGYMDLMVKNYFDRGTMSKYLNEIDVGTKVDFKHIKFNVKIQAPFSQSNIVMLTGGSGITPMIQALHAILGKNPNNHGTAQKQHQKVTMIYGSQRSDDILGRQLLDSWAKVYPEQLEVIDVLSNEPPDSSWQGHRGVINKDLLLQYLPPETGESTASSASDTLILVCGPPPMYDALSGPRDQPDTVSGILGDLGYTKEQVYKF